MDRATRDCILTDLGRKVADDTQASIRRTTRLMPDSSAGMVLAISAAASALGMAAGFASAVCREAGDTDPDPAGLVDGLWATLRPMILTAAGGPDDDFKALLAECDAAQSDPRRKAALMGAR